MTAQASDALVMDGVRFMVRDYIDDPPSVEPPPKDPLVSYSHCWGGYTKQWEVKDVEGEKQLFLHGYQSCGSEIDGYFPLLEPVMNPISEKVKVVPADAECIKYAHMGFESKYAGERNLVFQWGRLVTIEEIPDEEPNQDGILDMAGLHPEGEAKGREEIERILSSYSDEEDKPPKDVSNQICSACGEEMNGNDEWDPSKVLCGSCGMELVGIGKGFKNWRCDDEPGPYGASLFDTVSGYKSPKVNPDWHRKSRLLGVAFLRFGDGKKRVELEFSGFKTFQMKEKAEISRKTDPPLEERLLELIRTEILGYEDIEIDGRINEYLSDISVKKEFRLMAPVSYMGEKLDATAIAEKLEKQMDIVVEEWVAQLMVLHPILRAAWKQSLDKLTGGTGIYPYDPSEMTPQDNNIIWNFMYSKMRLDEIRKWAIPPRHTNEGWVPGVKVMDLYMNSLNI